METLLEKLKDYGADVEGAMARFINDEDLYYTCFAAFLEDECFLLLKHTVEDKEYQKAFEYAHTLKGISGNLGLTPIYLSISKMVEALRINDYDRIDFLYKELMDQYLQLQTLKK